MRALWTTDPGPDPALQYVFAADQPSAIAAAVAGGIDAVVTLTEAHEDYDCPVGDLHQQRCPGPGMRIWNRSTGALLRAVPDAGDNGFATPVGLVTAVLDGRHLAVVGEWGRPPKVIDLDTGRVRVLAGHTGAEGVQDLAIAELADGPAVTTVGWDGVLRVTQLRDGRTTTVEIGDRLAAVTVVSVAGRPVAATGRSDVTLWDLVNGTRVGVLELADSQIPAAIVGWPDDLRIAVLFTNGTIALWDTGTGSHRLLNAPSALPPWHIDAVIAADGRPLLGIADSETVTLWDIGADESFGPPLAGPVSYARMISGGPGILLVCSPVDDAISVWDLDSERPPAGSGLPTDIRRLTVTPGPTPGGEIVAGGRDGVLSRWQLTDGARQSDLGSLPGSVNAITAVDQGTKTYVLAVGGELDGTKDGGLHRWADLDALPPIALNHRGQTDIALTYFLDGESVVLTAGCNSQIQLTQVRTGRHLGTINAHLPRGIAVGLLAGRPVAAVCGLSGPFTLWDLATRTEVETPATPNIEIGEAALGWIDAGPTLVTVRESVVRLHNLQTGAVSLLEPDSGKPVIALAISDDPTRPSVAIARTDGTVSVVNAATRQNIDGLTLPYPAQALTWTTDNRLILACRREIYCLEIPKP